MSSANNNQVDGTHYKNKKIQPWDFIIQNNLGFLEGNVVKYVCRYQEKNGLPDLLKAKHYLEKLIETYKQVDEEESFLNQHSKYYWDTERNK